MSDVVYLTRGQRDVPRNSGRFRTRMDLERARGLATLRTPATQDVALSMAENRERGALVAQNKVSNGRGCVTQPTGTVTACVFAYLNLMANAHAISSNRDLISSQTAFLRKASR